MARSANSNSTTYGSVDQSGHTQSVSLSMYVSSNDGSDDREDMFTYWGYSSNPSTNQNFQGSQEATPPGTLWGGRSVSPTADTTWYWKTEGKFYNGFTLNATVTGGGTTARKTWAVDPTVGTPTFGTVTSSSVVVNFSWTPATNETAVDAIVQYKKTADSTWTDWTSNSDSDQTGYTSRSSPGNFAATTITGLDADTSYDFRIKVDRSGTQNTTKTYTGTPASTSTIADTPSVTTNAATSVGATSATLNATVDHNTVDGNLSWRYIATASYVAPPNDAQGTEVSYASNPITADGSGSKAITGLTASTGYTFWAIYDPTGAEDTVFGAAATFTTAANPAGVAPDEEHTVYIEAYAKYGVATIITFPLYSVKANSSDVFVTDPAALSSSTVYIYNNGVYAASGSPPAGGVVSPGKPLYYVSLLPGETVHNFVDLFITDGGTIFRDVHIHVTINRDLGQVDIDSSQNSNVSALILTGQGTGHGIEAVGGATGSDIEGVAKEMVAFEGTAQASASSTTIQLAAAIGTTANDDLNGCMILLHTGAGAGQARIITDYVHATQTATVHKAWNNYSLDPPDSTTEYLIFAADPLWAMKQEDTVQGVSPGAELSALPYYSDYYSEMLQYIFQRVAYKRTETAAVHKMYKVDDTEVLAQYGVEDTGDMETKEKAEDV